MLWECPETPQVRNVPRINRLLCGNPYKYFVSGPWNIEIPLLFPSLSPSTRLGQLCNIRAGAGVHYWLKMIGSQGEVGEMNFPPLSRSPQLPAPSITAGDAAPSKRAPEHAPPPPSAKLLHVRDHSEDLILPLSPLSVLLWLSDREWQRLKHTHVNVFWGIEIRRY